jgi:small subunit ribosomal protein S21
VIGVTLQTNENIDRAIRRFKKKYERSGVLREFKKRTSYTKPSIENRLARAKSARRYHYANMEHE